MLKLILTGVWVAVVALGTVYASVELSKPVDPAEEAAKQKAVQELVRGEMVTFPVIDDGDVRGYFLTKISYIVDKTKLAAITVPIPAVLTDEMFTALVGDRVIRIEDERRLDVALFRERIKTAVNKRLEADVVLQVIVEQIDYLSKKDLRAGQEQKQANIAPTMKIASEEIPADMADSKSADTSSGH